MHHAVLMNVRQPPRRLPGNLARLGHRQRPVPRDQLVGPDAVDVFHHQVMHRIGRRRRIDRHHDVRMLQRADRLDLLVEPADDFVVARVDEVLLDHFHRAHAAELRVPRAVTRRPCRRCPAAPRARNCPAAAARHPSSAAPPAAACGLAALLRFAADRETPSAPSSPAAPSTAATSSRAAAAASCRGPSRSYTSS